MTVITLYYQRDGDDVTTITRCYGVTEITLMVVYLWPTTHTGLGLGLNHIEI